MSLKKTVTGFSLVELMFVLVIVAILAGIGIPSLRATIDRNAITSEANRLYRAINFARSEAVNKQLFVTIDSKTGGQDWSAGWTIYHDSDGDLGTGFDAANDTLIQDVEVDTPTLTLLSDANAANRIIFNARGGIENNVDPGTGNLSFAVCDSANSDRIDGSALTISRVGRPRVTTIDATDKTNDCSF